MIYTVTFNPAIDYVMNIKNLKTGEVNRSTCEEAYFGGKGINVSLVLKTLGLSSKALGFCAGFTGKALNDAILAKGVSTDFIELASGLTRINVKLKSSTETDLNSEGPKIGLADFEQLKEKLSSLEGGDVLILAGSVPHSLPDTAYSEILELLSDKGVHFIVDATKELLVNTLKYRPFLIKPNSFELCEIFEKEISSYEDTVIHAQKLRKMGAQNVLISQSGDGALLVDSTGAVHKISAPNGNVISSVGSGDSMVAGFIAGYIATRDYTYALKLGTAAGSATAFSKGLATKSEIDKLMMLL